MIAFLLIAAASAVPAVGTPYPAATLNAAPEQKFCATRYSFSTSDPIDRIAAFYRRQADGAHIPLLDDSAARFVDYRTLVFVDGPKFLFILMSKKNGLTAATVAFHLTIPQGC